MSKRRYLRAWVTEELRRDLGRTREYDYVMAMNPDPEYPPPADAELTWIPYDAQGRQCHPLHPSIDKWLVFTTWEVEDE